MSDDRTTGSWADSDTNTGQDIDPEVEAKAAEIEVTRVEMTSTVEAIGEKLDPANIVEDAKETVREATVGKVETMAETVGQKVEGVAHDAGQMVEQAGTNVQTAGSSIIETIKQNPIPAAMAGIGLGWLLTHRASGNGGHGRWDQGGYRAYGSSYGSTGERGWYGQGRQGAYAGYGGYDEQRAYDTGRYPSDTGSWQRSEQGGVGDKVGEVASSVGETVGQVPERIGEVAGQMPQRIGEGAQGLGQQAQRVMYESPLAVGAAAVAVGAAIGLALPSTRVEQDVLGSTTEKLVDSVEQTATQAMQQVREDQEQQRDTTYSTETQAGL